MAIRELERQRFTLEEYLEIDRNSVDRSQYLDGRILDMDGNARRFTAEKPFSVERDAVERSEYVKGTLCNRDRGTITHNTITCNIISSLHSQLRDTPHRLYAGRLSVGVAPGLLACPDATVVSGMVELQDEDSDIVMNPTVIVEVMPIISGALCLSNRIEHFRHIATLTDYIVVAEHRSRAEHYEREPNGEWYSALIESPSFRLDIESIGCVLDSADIYDGITFPPRD